jgi:hypothetical protein
MEIIEVIVNKTGASAEMITGKNSSKKISKTGWIVIFLLVIALCICTFLNS